jgi:hypothetical protein
MIKSTVLIPVILSLVFLFPLQSAVSVDIWAQEQPPGQFKIYNDQEGRFSFSYPSNWDVNLPEDRFTKTSEVEVSTPENVTGWAAFDVRILQGLAESAEMLGLESAFDIGLSSARNDMPDFRLLEDIECEKYHIDGKETCSVQYTRGMDLGGSSLGLGSSGDDSNSNSFLSLLGRHAVQQVFPAGEDIYMLTYGADFDNFDKYLPIAEQIYSSFSTGEPTSSDNNDGGDGEIPNIFDSGSDPADNEDEDEGEDEDEEN